MSLVRIIVDPANRSQDYFIDSDMARMLSRSDHLWTTSVSDGTWNYYDPQRRFTIFRRHPDDGT